MNDRFSSAPLPAALALAALLGGCGGSIRVVRSAPSTGEIALVGDDVEARERAEDYMRRHCPEGHDVLEEGEAVVGSHSSTYAPMYGRRPGVFDTTTSDVTEWRIRYRCKVAPAPSAVEPVPRPAAVPPAAPSTREAPTRETPSTREAPLERRAPPERRAPAPPAHRPAPADSSSWGTSVSE
jgi:hypothetical protein